MNRLWSVSLASLLAACAGPWPERPQNAQVAPPAAWRTVLPGTGAVTARWWQGFGDPALASLIERALADNTDLASAAARIEEARAVERTVRSQRSPTLDAAVDAQQSRSLGSLGTAVTGLAAQPTIQIAYELDLSGRIAALVSGARADTAAAQDARDAVALTIAADVARSYVDLLALDARLKVTRETLAARAEALRVARRRATTGYTSFLELRQAEAEYRAAAQLVPQLELQATQAENALSVLAGAPPGPVPRGASLDRIVRPPIPGELPSELLRRRPDIAAAERRIESADASLAAARADFLPRINLGASAGVALSSLLPDPVTLWSVGGSVLAPIFDAGRIRAQADAATARRDQAAYAYRGTALTAFREVEDSLAAVRRTGEQAAELRLQREALAGSLRLASNRYRAGYASYIEQLDAQRQLLSAELSLIDVEEDSLSALITLYQALGGGWQA
jgi:NodT family efflux transporter outer membrane factor (OMF) lipoprotein